MEQKKTPFRSVWCGRYSACLDEAVSAGDNFDCRGCAMRFDQSAKGELVNVFPEALLLVAVLYPPIYRILRSIGDDCSFHWMLRELSPGCYKGKVHGVLRSCDADWQENIF